MSQEFCTKKKQKFPDVEKRLDLLLTESLFEQKLNHISIHNYLILKFHGARHCCHIIQVSLTSLLHALTACQTHVLFTCSRFGCTLLVQYMCYSCIPALGHLCHACMSTRPPRWFANPNQLTSTDGLC